MPNIEDSVVLITSVNSNHQDSAKKNRKFGTGFVISREKDVTYILTCAHVVEDVGGQEQVKVAGMTATVVALGNSQGCDLAILKVKEFKKLPLPTYRDKSAMTGRNITIAGFYQNETGARFFSTITGRNDKQLPIYEEGVRTPAWELQIDPHSDQLQPGYSGSPVVDAERGYVMGVVAQLWDKGKKGLAISIEAVQQIWSGDFLDSEVGVDYTELRNLLRDGNWREAAVETDKVMLKVSTRESEGFLRKADIEKFPCADLRTIDQLWVKYSDGRFGFSVQKRIWEEVGGNPESSYETMCKLGDRVGWRRNEEWVGETSDLTFTDQAPKGHLPYFWPLLSFSKFPKWNKGTFLISGQRIPYFWPLLSSTQKGHLLYSWPKDTFLLASSLFQHSKASFIFMIQSYSELFFIIQCYSTFLTLLSRKDL